ALARGVNVEKKDDIGKIESARKVLHQMHRSGKAMRLEHRKNAAEAAGFCGAQRGANRRGVVRIIVHNSNPFTSLDLESPIHALKVAQCGGDNPRLHAHVTSRRKGSGGVENVMQARHTELDTLGCTAVETQSEVG